MGILFDRPDPERGKKGRASDPAFCGRMAELLSYDRRSRELRRTIFDTAVINDSCWHILQDLFAAHLAGEDVRTKHLVQTTGLPQTTVLRYLDHLQTFDAVRRDGDPDDSRVTLVSLSPVAVSWMNEYYVQLAQTEARDAGPRSGSVIGGLWVEGERET